MYITLPNARAAFKKEDFEFMLRTLSRSQDEQHALESLFLDNDAFNQILDDADICHALHDSTEPLKLSLEFYFYVIVRRVLLQNGIEERETADYIAAVIASRARQQNDALQSFRNSPLLCTTDWSIEFENAPESYRFELLIFAAETLLVVTGLFPEHVSWREERRAAPGIDWYAGKCRQGYEQACKHHLAQKHNMDHIYGSMADCFPIIRDALNRMQNAYMHFEQLPEFN